MVDTVGAFWSLSADQLFLRLQTTREGLSSEEADRRLARYGRNLLRARKRAGAFGLLLRQFQSPIVLILIFAAGVSFFLRDATDAAIILGIVFISSLLGFWQERAATNAVAELLSTVQTVVPVLRDGKPAEISLEGIVPGDVILLSAGKTIPGDCLILECKDLFVDEAALTGETYPAEKAAGVLPVETRMAERTNMLFMGTHVVSGSAQALVVHTGRQTEFAKVSERLRFRPPETEFERGVKQFGYLLLEVTLTLVFAIFALNVYLKRPFLDSFLFSLALAVGLTPQLLPAIITVNLARGAKRMAQRKVIVRRLMSIENFGSMNVLCSDKTGTLTEGVMRLVVAADLTGKESEKVLFYAYLNSFYETGFTSPIDEALRSDFSFDLSGFEKLDEVPYDFIRKRLSVLVGHGDQRLLSSKGAFKSILEVCALAEDAEGHVVDLDEVKEAILHRFDEFSRQGFRTLGVAYRDMDSFSRITRDDETKMTLLGFLVFSDPVKKGVAEVIGNLRRAGVTLKLITGDNHVVAGHVAREVGISNPVVLTGSELRRMSDEAMLNAVQNVDVFAEVEPNQKERIVLALTKAGYIAGFMGDGINDAPALHAADVGISVNSAVDVAKEAADIVLLEKDLAVLADGICEGRATFANTLKYVLAAASANFGNMFSMAGASLFLPFLPLLPKQVLLTNLMTDFPEMTIATDSVDQEFLQQPHRWNIKFIRKFMVCFGILSTAFDYAIFGVLLLLLHATTGQFRAGWFVESVISASLVVMVIRSRHPFFKSRPSKYLLLATSIVVGVTLLLPYAPLAALLGFKPLPVSFLLAMAGIVVAYLFVAETAKRVFYRRIRL